MKEIITTLTNHLAANCPALKYVAPDWGQLDYYSDHPPVKWPCALVDIAQANYTQQGEGEQHAVYTLLVRIAALPLGNTSAAVPTAMQEAATQWWNLPGEVHLALQGHVLADNCTPLVRTTGRRLRRDDGVMLWEVTYTMAATEEMPLPEKLEKPPLVIARQIKKAGFGS
jgi:hypothetical protein